MSKSNGQENPNINLIGEGTVIKGDVKTNGDIRIDGTLVGSVQAKGKIVVGVSGNIEGEIVCQNSDISGMIKAKITVAELLALKSTSNLTGDIITNKLSIEPGAKFSGTCTMSDHSTASNKFQTNEVIGKGKEKKIA